MTVKTLVLSEVKSVSIKLVHCFTSC